jgi:DNA processing protein
VAGLAPQIERVPKLDRQSLLSLLALGDVQLCRAAGITNICATLNRARTISTAGAIPIGATAHHGALHAGGQTIAVAGCAAETPYPRQLDHLHTHIAARGAVISEYQPGFTRPRRWCLLAAKRIVAALADVLVIVEAGERSSTLLAAQVAADLGHDVAIVPGRVTDPGTSGTLALLRDGAHPVASAQDVLDLIPNRPARRPAHAPSSALHAPISSARRTNVAEGTPMLFASLTTIT